MSKERSVLVKQVSMSKADGYVVSEQEHLQNFLKRLGLLGEGFGYRAFNPTRLQHVLETGSDRTDEKIFLCRLQKADHGEIVIADDGGVRDVFEYLEENGSDKDNLAMLAVYDGSHFTVNENGHMVFIDPTNKRQALLAIVEIKDLFF